MRQCSRHYVRTSVLVWLFFVDRAGAGAIGKSDLVAYLGGGDDIRGQTLTTAVYELTVLANSTAALVSLSYDKAVSEVGWLGWGLGTGMAGADIVVLWPNEDGSWTLSHRTAPSTVMPTVTDATTPASSAEDASGELRVIAALSSSSSSDTSTVVSFTRPLAPSYKTTAQQTELKLEINQPVIYAAGDDNPGESDPTADIKQHTLDSMGSTFIDLSTTFDADGSAIDAPLFEASGGSSGSTAKATGSATASAEAGTGAATKEVAENGSVSPEPSLGSTATASASTSESTGSTAPSSSATASTGKLAYADVIKYHGICAAVAWVATAPVGVLIARLGRGCLFFPWHWGVQVFFTTTLSIGAVSLAYWAVKLKGSGAVHDIHFYLGFSILALVVCQCLIGLYVHLAHLAHSRTSPARGRGPRNWVHICLGLSLITAGFVQVHLGMGKYGVTDDKIRYGYYAAVSIFCTLYLISAIIAVLKNPAAPTLLSRLHHRRKGTRAKSVQLHHHQHVHHHLHHHHLDHDQPDRPRRPRRDESEDGSDDSDHERERHSRRTRHYFQARSRSGSEDSLVNHHIRRREKEKKEKEQRGRRRRGRGSSEQTRSSSGSDDGSSETDSGSGSSSSRTGRSSDDERSHDSGDEKDRHRGRARKR